jgi:hypothetical protein
MSRLPAERDVTMTTKALRRSTCRYCRCPIGLSQWSGWIDLSPGGSHDMCPGLIAGVHEPDEEADV